MKATLVWKLNLAYFASLRYWRAWNNDVWSSFMGQYEKNWPVKRLLTCFCSVTHEELVSTRIHFFVVINGFYSTNSCNQSHSSNKHLPSKTARSRKAIKAYISLLLVVLFYTCIQFHVTLLWPSWSSELRKQQLSVYNNDYVDRTGKIPGWASYIIVRCMIYLRTPESEYDEHYQWVYHFLSIWWLPIFLLFVTIS